MDTRSIIRHIERLEAGNLSDGGVSLLELMEDGTWELTNSRGEKNVYRTQEDGITAHMDFLRKHKSDESRAVLIIIDL